MKKIRQLREELKRDGMDFSPVIIKKYTTRYLRLDELERSRHGEEADVVYVHQIPEECDLVYQTYGIRYGMETQRLSEELDRGNSPVLVVNDIRVVEEIKKFFSGRVLSLYLFRKIPELEDFKREAQNRGNMSEQEVVARYDKAVAIYRIYIENIILFDKVILNSIEYEEGEELSNQTILDMQLRNVLLPIIKGEKRLRHKMEYPKLPRIFVIAGNAASGKDELIRALLSMGKLQARVLPKYTMRQQEPEDGREMICRYIPKKSWLERLKKEYDEQRRSIEENLNKMEERFKAEFRSEFVSFEQRLKERTKNEYERFWRLVKEEMEEKGARADEILYEYYEENSAYVDLTDIRENGYRRYMDQGVGIYERGDRSYIIYGNDGKLYGCDITEIQKSLEENRGHFVIVASQIGVVNVLKKKYGEKNVRLIYAHSEISASEFEANASDITKGEKKKEFREILDNYTKEISNYDHVTIYARTQLNYEQTSREEELIDQMFRLLRAY